MAEMVISMTPPASLVQVVRCYVRQFANRVERYSDQVITQSFDKLKLEKTVSLIVGQYDRKLIFQDISSFYLQDGIIVIQAHKTPSSILLSISLKISNQLFQSIDREMRPPGLRYSKSFLSSENPDSILWKIEDTEEGVLQFPLCLLPQSAYTEVLVFSPPVTDPNCEPKLLRFSNQKGKLALTNTSGDPPQPNEPTNESRIKHYSLLILSLSFRNT